MTLIHTIVYQPAQRSPNRVLTLVVFAPSTLSDWNFREMRRLNFSALRWRRRSEWTEFNVFDAIVANTVAEFGIKNCNKIQDEMFRCEKSLVTTGSDQVSFLH